MVCDWVGPASCERTWGAERGWAGLGWGGVAGAADFGYAASAMVVLVVPALGTLLVAPQYLGLGGVWMGLTLLMTMRMLAGFYRSEGGRGSDWYWYWLLMFGRSLTRAEWALARGHGSF